MVRENKMKIPKIFVNLKNNEKENIVKDFFSNKNVIKKYNFI